MWKEDRLRSTPIKIRVTFAGNYCLHLLFRMHSFTARERPFRCYENFPYVENFPSGFFVENNLPGLYKRTLLSSGIRGKKSITSFTHFSCLLGCCLRKAAELCPGLMTCYDIWLQLLWYYTVKWFPRGGGAFWARSCALLPLEGLWRQRPGAKPTPRQA